MGYRPPPPPASKTGVRPEKPRAGFADWLAKAATAAVIVLALTWLILSLIVIGYYFAMILPILTSILTNLLNVI